MCPSSYTIVPVPTLGTWVQSRNAWKPRGLRWFVGGGALFEELKKLFGSVYGVEKVEDRGAHAPVVYLGFVAGSQGEVTVENDVGEGAFL